ncbi:MAG: response regulator transcription factor [Bacteroidia bacterium]|jgi:two-component system alkaline phosphatase synthesis response regulator PhoP|nr:response regulator transcription factor [Bacteroidia bacterium]
MQLSTPAGRDFYRLIIADSDRDSLQALKSATEMAGYEVKVAASGQEVLDLAKKFVPHLVLLEVSLNGIDGIEVCHELRQQNNLNRLLIAFYTSRTEDYTQIAAFEAGADDYLVKPVKPSVLLARLNALLKRYRGVERQGKLVSGSLVLDRERYLVFRDQQEIMLARKEFELLALLLATPRKVYTRQEIYREIWGGEFGEKNRTIDVHIRKLREKVGEQFIKTIKGIGYAFDAA